MDEKKGIQLSQAFGAVMTLVLVAVLVIVAIVIFVTLEASFTSNRVTASAANDTLTAWTGAAANKTVTNAAACGFGVVDTSTVVVYIINATDNEIIAAANYTAYNDGNIINVTAGVADLQAWSVSYDYTWGTAACTASENMTAEFGNYTSLIGLVGTIIFLGLVIGVLVASFAFGRKEV